MMYITESVWYIGESVKYNWFAGEEKRIERLDVTKIKDI